MLGYQGKMLEVDLSQKKVEVNPVPEEWYAKYIGGEGFAAKLVY